MNLKLRVIPLFSFFLFSTFFPIFAEPLQNDLFVIVEPNGFMGKSPVWPCYKVADSSSQWGKKLYDAIANDSKIREVLLKYQKAQTETLERYKKQLLAEGKSGEEIQKLLAEKAKPIYFVLKNGNGTPLMESGSAFIQTYKNGKLDTDFQYICPKVKVTKGWEGFSTPPEVPFKDGEKREFMNLVAHETSHAIMKELYGYIPKSLNPWAAVGHWEGKMTSRQLAFTEGYAEFMGAWYSGSDDYGEPRFNKDIDHDMMPKTQSENKKTEGVVACILWDIAKGEGGIQNGMEKIHKVLREKKPWTIDGFAKGFKELFPQDAAAIDEILKENLIPEKERLSICWVNVRYAKKNWDNLQKEYEQLSWFKNPIKKAKAWWKLAKAKKNYKKILGRYQSIYGYTLEELTSPNFPKEKASVNPPSIPNSGEEKVTNSVSGVKVNTSGVNPFSE